MVELLCVPKPPSILSNLLGEMNNEGLLPKIGIAL